MENLISEITAKLKQQQIRQEMDVIRLEEEAGQGKNLLSKSLAALGEWMVIRGEKLRKRHSAMQSGSVELIKKVA